MLNKIKSSEYNWKKNKLNFLINDCINIENKINELDNINAISKSIKKTNPLLFQIKFEEKKINKFLEKIKNIGNLNDSIKTFNSKIDFDENLVKSWLDNKFFIAELLFRKTKDGSEIKNFHEKCDNKGNTIIFIETKKGNKFGGYTTLSWGGSGSKKDKSAFLFSFNNKEKYISQNDNDSIYCSSYYGPTFGTKYKQQVVGFPPIGFGYRFGYNELLYNSNNNQFSSYNNSYVEETNYFEIYFSNSLDKGQSYGESNSSNSSRYTFFYDRKLTNGKEYWDVKELEVYKIIYI